MSHIPQQQQEEYAFVQSQINKLASVPVQYGDDFTTPDEGKPRKAQLVDIPVTPLPEVKKIEEKAAGPSSDTLPILIKSHKPPLSFHLPAASLSDPVSALKAMLLASYPTTAPPPSHQRLLLKGKALSDGKLLREYIQQTKEGGEEVTINLMIKAGWPASGEQPVLEPLDTTVKGTTSHSTPPTVAAGSGDKPLTPIPTLTLTPSPDLSMGAERTSTSPSHSPHQTLSNPTFWVELLSFFRSQYAKEDEADAAWETFLRSQKGAMSPSEVAMARDESGVHGMGGM